LNLSYNRFIDFFNEASKGKARLNLESLYFQEFKELALYANKMVEQREMAEQGFRQIVELSPFPICIYNHKNILYVNPQWIKIIGYNISEISTLQRTLVTCFADREERRFVFKQKNNPKTDNLYKISCKDGQIRYMKLNFISMQDNNSMITLEDYSLRKKIEDDLNAARRKAEESDSLKSAFLANMSHEIRTPMNAIIGFSGLLQNDSLAAEKRKRYLELIHKSSESLLNLINDILDISKIEAGQMNFQFAKGNLAETFAIVEAESKSICQTMNKQNVEIMACYDLKNEEGIIETDFLRLKQVLMNLLSNALKFTSQGKIEFGCRLLKSNTMEFFVRDTGMGIKPIHLDGIFNRFTKIEEDSTKMFRGAGLGLAISRKLVENLGGTIGVKSVYGEGSEFYFTIPVKHKPHRKNIVKTF
jgi:PAS domain S-box-containing protein